jgi:ankyrin repeat protein
MVACHEGHPSIVEMLIRRGASLDLKDKNEETAFDLLDHDCNGLSQEEKTRLKDLPRLLKQEQLKH